ncbi:MAG: signal recognition particle-docking protein FtsY [Candidatus Cloacimonadota bacterium]|nr:signal recognition particle-docking protein FtsY [Candidatus Cloacimonadota bacterium]
MSLISILKRKLAKTHNVFVNRLAEVIRLSGKVDEELMEDIEGILIQSDIGIKFTDSIIKKLKEEIRVNKIKKTDKIFSILEKIIIEILTDEYVEIHKINYSPSNTPYVIFFVGVNGVGKTTTIAKLAKKFKKAGNKVLLVAADTFRAAAIEQLEIWAKRIKVDIIGQNYGADPSSVVFNALISAKAKKYDVVLVDTAGRLHTKENLMRELGKIQRIARKIISDAPHETLLIIDATTGQNGIQQAKKFLGAINVTGVILTKLDGTAKGGVAIGIKDNLGIPIKAIGIGEQVDDLRNFNAQDFVKAIFEN